MAWYDGFLDRIRGVLGMPRETDLAIPPPTPPMFAPPAKWVRFVWTLTFVATRTQNKQYQKMYRNTGTGEIITLGKGRPSADVKKTLDDWKVAGVYEEVRVERLRWIEATVVGTCSQAAFENRVRELVPETFGQMLIEIRRRSAQIRAEEAGRGVPTDSQTKVFDYTFVFNPSANMLETQERNVSQRERYRSQPFVGTIKFPELARIPEETMSWRFDLIDEPKQSVMTAQLYDHTYDRMIFQTKEQVLPKDWPRLSRETLASTLLGG